MPDSELARGASIAGTVVDTSTRASLGKAMILVLSLDGSYEQCGSRIWISRWIRRGVEARRFRYPVDP